MRILRTILWLSLLWLAVSGRADEPASKIERQFLQHLAKMSDRQRESLLQHMTVRIDDMHRVCQLSESQYRKLSIAAKGAVERTMETWHAQMKEWKKQMVQQFGGLGFGDFPAIQVEEANAAGAVVELGEEDEVIVENQNVDDQFVVQANDEVLQEWIWQVDAQAGDYSEFYRQLMNQSVWQTSLRTVLTDTQRQKYEAAVAERATFKRRSTIAKLVATIDEQVLLSPEQRRKLAAIIDKALGESLQSQPTDPFAENATMLLVSQQMDKRQLADVLSPAQLGKWSDYEKRYSQMMGWGAAGGFFNVAPVKVNDVLNGPLIIIDEVLGNPPSLEAP